jgi:NADH-quinone oxidoreductase subunit G
MPEFFINGQPVHAERDQTVLQAALAAGFYIPYFCWHPHLSVAGNCRLCVVEVEGEKGGSNWMEISCNMPITEGMRVLTDSEPVRERRRQTLQLVLLNHPVDCGICDKAGECSLQDAHYAYNGELSASREAKVAGPKFHELSERIVLDNERCILCSRCVRFTNEVSGSHSLGIQFRGDHSLVRAAEDGSFARDPYSDNVVDICPVGALLSRQFLYRSRVWYLEPTPSVCPGCARGCHVNLWHRKREWALREVGKDENLRIQRITPRPCEEVNGDWMCNTGRDLVAYYERPRAATPLLKGAPASAIEALARARELLRAAQRPVAVVSGWASNEELAAFRAAFGSRLGCVLKTDRPAAPGEPVADEVLIRADKNPNTRGVQEALGPLAPEVPADADLLLVWGEGYDLAKAPRGARLILMSAFLAPENGHADVFLPLSLPIERAGHWTNEAGVTSRFEPCFAPPAGVLHAESILAQLASHEEATA